MRGGVGFEMLKGVGGEGAEVDDALCAGAG